MGWIIEAIANNLTTITGGLEILSGIRRILFASLLISCCSCTYTRQTIQDTAGRSTDIYALSWGASTAEQEPQPRRHVSRRQAMRAEQDREVAASPLSAKWYK